MKNRIRLPFKSDEQRKTFDAVFVGLSALGYSEDLLLEDYRFGDWFSPDLPERTVHVAAFGQLPPSYETACLAVVLANGEVGEPWIKKYRSLGAPYLFEVRNREVVKWSLGANRVQEDLRFGAGSVAEVFRDHRDWSRTEVLRAKNIVLPLGRPDRQLDLFLDTGLIPALEQEIQTRLAPILERALSSAIDAYRKGTAREPDPTALFQLAFRLLAGKVLFDRGVPKLRSLGAFPDADDVIRSVSEYYRDPPKSYLTRAAHESIYNSLWTRFDFRNLSIEVLTYDLVGNVHYSRRSEETWHSSHKTNDRTLHCRSPAIPFGSRKRSYCCRAMCWKRNVSYCRFTSPARLAFPRHDCKKPTLVFEGSAIGI